MDSPEDRELSRAPFRCHPPKQGRSASYTQDDSLEDRELSRAPPAQSGTQRLMHTDGFA